MAELSYAETSELIRNARTKSFILTDKNGSKTTHRLFVSPEGIIAEYKRRSTRYGYPLSLEQYCHIHENSDDPIKTIRRNTNKIQKYLKASGLWTCFLNDLEKLAILSDESLERINSILGDWKKLEVMLKEHNITRLGTQIICNLFDKKCIKTARYNRWDRTDEIISLHLERKEQIRSSWQNGYDCSISLRHTEDGYKGWYSEEYRGCGNGYYYLLLDQKHVLFLEKD